MLSAKRMKVAFKLDIEKDQRVWDRCTADDLKGGMVLSDVCNLPFTGPGFTIIVE